jgi:exoribonuclease R
MTPEEIAKRQTQMMKDSLQLDEKQLAKVDAINLEYAKKMMELREKDLPQAERMQEFQVMQTNKDYEIKKCLNKEQAKRYQKIQEAMRARRQERRKEKEN